MSEEARRLLKVIGVVTVVTALAIALLIYIGVISSSSIQEVPGIPDDQPIIEPNAENPAGAVETTVKLYFRYGSMLACETRTVKTYSNQLVEHAALKELLSGPLEGSELERVMDSQTTIVSVSAEGDTLYVTLSNEFLRESANLPDGWGEDAALREEEYLRKRLAVYSVVNSLAGIGNYSHVQLMIDVDRSGIGQRVTMGKLGFTENSQLINTLISPMAYDSDVVLSAENTAEALLSALQSGDTSTVYSLMAKRSAAGANRPLYDNVAAKLKTLVTRVEAFAIVGWDHSADGSSAVVWADITYKTPAGESVKKTLRPHETAHGKRDMEDRLRPVICHVLRRIT